VRGWCSGAHTRPVVADAYVGTLVSGSRCVARRTPGADLGGAYLICSMTSVTRRAGGVALGWLGLESLLLQVRTVHSPPRCRLLAFVSTQLLCCATSSVSQSAALRYSSLVARVGLGVCVYDDEPKPTVLVSRADQDRTHTSVPCVAMCKAAIHHDRRCCCSTPLSHMLPE
jgi:hypothetical protein